MGRHSLRARGMGSRQTPESGPGLPVQLRPLLTHQQQAMAYAQVRQGIALFMEMRLGKSIVAIRWIHQHTTAHRILVVAPLSVLPGWLDELALEHVPQERRVWLLGSVAQRIATLWATPRPTQPTWFLTNYEALLRGGRQFSDFPWDAVILDESTKIKNSSARTTKLLLRAYGAVPYRAILSGLPAPESPFDYFAQMTFVDGEFMGHTNFWNWRQRFFYEAGWDWLPKKKTEAKIRQAVHTSAFLMTRKEAGLGDRKIYERRVVALSPAQRTAYRQVRKDFAFEDLRTQWATTRMLWMARIAGGFTPEQPPALMADGKLKELETLLQGELRQEPVVVWFRFNAELAAAFHLLQRRGVSVAAILGATPIERRHERLQRFQRGAVRVLLIQVKCGKYGLNCSAASTAIYYSNSYSLEERKQSEARIEHALKREPLLYIDLVTAGTVDQAVSDVLQEKNLHARLYTSRLIDRLIRVHQEAA